MGRQQQGRHIGSAQPGKGLLRASLAPGARRRNAGGREAASTIRRRRVGVARAVRQERLSVDVCRESQTGCLCAACLHEEIEVGNRNTKARCRIDRSAPQTCACTRRRGLRKWLKSRFTKAAVTSSLISGSPPQKRRNSQRKADSFRRLTKRSSAASSHSWRPRAVAARTSPPFPRFFVVGWKA